MSMRRIFTTGTLAHKLRGSVAAIGVFDGVHRGHQKVIARAVAEARRLKLLSVVVTFDPHPVHVLSPGKFLPQITTLEHRLRLIEGLGADVCVVVRFNRRFAAQKPEKFVREFLIKQLGVKKVVIGRDFHFGQAGQGSVDLLRSMEAADGFVVEHLGIARCAGKSIKSTYIRELITAGDLAAARRFLARPHAFLGKVVGGDARGRKLGYRTANFEKENVIILPSGIYLVRASWDRRTAHGLCYIGCRPTFKRRDARIIQELHLLDHQGDLYGKMICMEFIRKLRDDRKFPDENSLTAQIGKDVRKARSFFKIAR